MHINLHPDTLTKRLNGLTIVADDFHDQKFLALMAAMVFRGEGHITLEGQHGSATVDIEEVDVK